MKLLEALRPTDEGALLPLSETPAVKHAETAWRAADAAFQACRIKLRTLNHLAATGDRQAKAKATHEIPAAQAAVDEAELALNEAEHACSAAHEAAKARILAARSAGAVALAQARLQTVDELLDAHARCVAYNQETDALVGSECTPDVRHFTAVASQLLAWREGQS